MVSEVFELDKHLFSPFVSNRLHEFLDEFFVLFSLHSWKFDAWVHRVFQKILIICANVDLSANTYKYKLEYTNLDWKSHVRTNAGACSVKGELADGNSHSLAAEIAKAEDTLAVSDNNGADICLWPVVENRSDVSFVVNRNEEATRTAEDGSELLTSKADSWRVNDRHVLLNVGLDESVKERLVTLVQCHKK